MAEFFERMGLAFKCFFLVLFAGRLPDNMPEKYSARTGIPRGGATAPTVPAQVQADGGPVAGTRPPPSGSSSGLSAGQAQAATEARPPVDRAVQLLALFQRDGRLVDFLAEDIAGYPDDQVGAAVREVHASCRDVLTKYVSLEPVIAGEEGRPTVVDAGFDVACVKLVGTVTGKPPFRGILRHKGWRAGRVDLPAVPDEGARNVIAPAEVEIG